MRFLSVCSGIEAASTAWGPLGWEAVAFSEIEKFPCAVLKHHYPDVPNLGDMTKFKEWKNVGSIDVLCGGTPCQSFSVAGLRKGMDDPRGQLSIVFLGLLDRFRPRWVVWENVPGVLSADGGRAFGAFVGGLGELGYGWAYRVLDAQYFGVPQRRRRVFVVGYLGDWRRAAAVLFERESLSGNPPPSRKEGEGVAQILEAGARTGKSTDDIRAGSGIGDPGDPMFTLQSGKQHAIAPIGIDEECNATINGFGPLLRGGQGGTRQAVMTVGTLTASGAGTERPAGQGNELDFCVIQDARGMDKGQNGIGVTEGGPAYTLDQLGSQAIAFSSKDYGADVGSISPVLRAMGHNKSHQNGGGQISVALGQSVRRLTPRECERLQGFPDDYTLIPYRGKPAADGPRYKALGNSWAVPVVRWIGERISVVDKI